MTSSMISRLPAVRWCAAAVAALLLAGRAPSATGQPLAKAGALAPSPRYDLLLHRARVRTYDAGLELSLAADAVRLYDLALRDVWGPPASPRRLTAPARLSLPWRGGPAELTVRFAGKGQLAVGKARRALAGKGLTEQRLALGALPAGELAVTLTPKSGFAVASLRLAAPGAAACPAPLAVPADSLGGARALALSVEVPAQAALAFTPHGGAGVVWLRGEAGQQVELWRGRGDGARQVVALPAAAQVVELTFESAACDVRWQRPELGVLAPAPTLLAPARARHLLLIVVDTLRADRLAAITATRVRTPNLSAAVARGGLVAPRHLAIAPSSPPSHATLHSGQLPRVHGAVGDTAPLSPQAPLLAALLRERGFFTGYVGNNDFAMGRLAKAARWSAAHTPVFEGQGIDCVPLVERALELMQRALAAEQRAFLTLLPIEPHVPYRFHEGITEQYFAGPYGRPLGKRVTSAHLTRARRGLPDAGWEQLRALYDGEVTYFDQCYGALEAGLRRLGVADDTAIVLTSDHGEGLGERGNNTGHAYSLHHELVWVPLLLLGGPFAARGEPVRLPTATSNLDVAPTVLELLGEPVDPRMQGQSLAPLWRGERQWPRAVASEYGKAYAVSAGRWHYVADYEGRGKLYDVQADPAQLRDRSGDAPVPLRYLREAAATFLSQRVRWRGAWGGWTTFSPANPLAGRGAAP